MNETKADREKEQAVASRLESVWGLSLRKLYGQTYPADYAIYEPMKGVVGADGELVGLVDVMVGMVEVKCRTKQFWPFMIALHKVHRMLDYARDWGIPTILAVEYEGEVLLHRLNKGYTLSWGGNSRGQLGDKEPVVLIPIERWSRLEDKKDAPRH